MGHYFKVRSFSIFKVLFVSVCFDTGNGITNRMRGFTTRDRAQLVIASALNIYIELVDG